MCFSNKIQVEKLCIEKSVKERQRLVSTKGFSIFLTRYLKKGLMKFETWGRFIKNKKMCIQYKILRLD